MAIEIEPIALTAVLERLERVLEKTERLLAAQLAEPAAETLEQASAFIWQHRNNGGVFLPVRHLDPIRLTDLLGPEMNWHIQKLARNTRQFLIGAPANHVLLWGERGTGKSSLIKALLNEYAEQGLRLVQVHRQDLLDLPEITDRLWDRPEKYILFCDDLSFESDDAEYKELKAILEGGLHARPTNLLIYATSNRRHLIPEHMADRQVVMSGDEAHANDAIDEQLSLADRFGVRLGFYHLDQDTYLQIVRQMVDTRGIDIDPDRLENEARRWALTFSSRSGRTARQFVDDLEGRLALEKAEG